MRVAWISAAALAGAALAAPATAQGSGLSANQVEFFSEMLAMGNVCGQLSGFRVERDNMQDWLADRLSSETDDDISSVFAQRDVKLEAIQEHTSQVRELDEGFSRQEAVEEHYAEMLRRCQRLSNHSLAGEYFLRTTHG